MSSEGSSVSDGSGRGARRAAVLEPELNDHPELLQVLLAVFRDLELAGQLKTMLDQALGWTGGDCGFGLMAGDDPETWVPMVTTLTRGKSTSGIRSIPIWV